MSVTERRPGICKEKGVQRGISTQFGEKDCPYNTILLRRIANPKILLPSKVPVHSCRIRGVRRSSRLT